MPLVRKMYRGGKVWVETDADGQPLVENGLVKIRYREEDDRTYSARAAEVEDIDEARLKQGGGPKGPGQRGTRASKRDPREKSGGSGAVDQLPPDSVVVFTDGACYGNPGPAGIGVLLEWRGRRKEISRFLGEGTNNIAELTAIREALEAIQQRDLPVHLFTDSSYAIGVLSLGWKARENLELIREIQLLMQDFPHLELHKVRGHSGDPRNERADQLARDGIDIHGR